MDTSLSSKTGRLEQSEVEDLKSEFTSECSFLPDNQHSCMGDKQHLQVYLRIRPFTPEESKKGESQDCVTMEGPDTVLLRPPSSSVTTRFSMDRAIPQAGQRFRFSKVFGPETTQRELFNGTVKDLVKDTLEGRSALVFTYGVTNAGKTFTFLGPDADAGILPRSLDIIFNSMEGHVFSGMSIKPHRCQELSRLNEAQQAEEALFKRNLFRQSVEIEKSKSILSSLSSETFLAGSFPAKTSAAAEDRVNLKVELTTKFSVWVSFCEIYNENIHDLLEVTPGGAQKRMALRLSQDINGNAFIKDLRWVQVETAEEAYKVVKLGKKNQSFCSTRLNNLSSRSHSIFSIRILRIEDVNVPLVSTVSELCLCDLAGSERCAKTQNKGERLKEAGNINTSLLILGKCINALRNNQHTKLLQHVPFRESKLTHYLQGFFCGRGKTCMIVNINQCASMYDETLGVLKFSAVAQKVAVLFSKPFVIMPLTSTSEVPLNQSTEKKAIYSSDRSSLIGWESSLDDVQEDENLDEDVSFMEETLDNFVNKDDEKVVIIKGKLQRLIAELKQLQVQLKKERAESMLLEGRIREETSQEFSQLFHEMQKDFTERLAREKEILEDRAEKRMQICRNLINKMYNSGSSQDAQDMDTSAELADRDFAEVSYFRQSLSQAGPQTCRTDTGIKLESSDQQKTQNQLADDPDAIEERRIVLQLQEKSAEVARLTEHLGELQKLLAQASTTPSVELEQRSPQKKNQLEEAFAALEKAKTEKEEAIAALEYQTLGKEEALTFLEEERKAREEAIASLKQLRRLNEEMQELLEQEKRGKEKAAAALEIEKRANEDFVSALSKEKQSREEAHAALCEERRRTQEVQSDLESERTKSWELAEERGRMQQEVDALQRELRQLTEKLEAAEQQVANKTEVAEQALAQVGAVQTQLETESSEVQEKTCQLETLTQKLQTLEEELLTNHISSEGDREKLKEELLELQSKLAEQKDQREKAQSHVQELEHELTQVKKQLAQNQLVSEQISDKLSQAEASSKEKQEAMLHKLTDELRAQFECQLREAKEEMDQLRANLQEQTNGSDKQIRQLNEQLQKQDLLLKQQHEDWTQKLTQENETSSKHLNDLKEKLSQKEQALNLLEAELASKLSSNLKTEEDLRRLNSDLQSEVASLKATLSNMKAKEFSVDIDQMLKVKDEQMKEKLAELKRASEDREAELKKKVLEAEAQVASLQKTLLAAQEKREEDECQAVREARRKEVERRKELLAVAHEAIAQKDAELEKKTEEISRLKEIAKQDAEKMKTLHLDLQRKEEDSSDLQEKLTDYKKQMQQVQKEISAMREEEKLLKQKLADLEKTKKQLQCDLSTRDRTIQQLRLDQSNTKCDETHQLYSKACKDLKAKERVLEEMRLALVEQDETQEKMEKVLEEKLIHIQELCNEVDRLKNALLQQSSESNFQEEANNPSDEVKQAKEKTFQVQESLKILTEKHQTERKKWLEEKLSLIGQAKEAEDKRNQEMRKFVEDRERYSQQQGQLESQLVEKEKTMENWRKERDTLVAALEVQLQKLLSSQAEKDKLIEQLRQQNTQPAQELQGFESSSSMANLQASVTEKEAEILQLRRELEESRATQSKSVQGPSTLMREPKCETSQISGKEDIRASGSSQGSTGFPSVLDSSEISTENGRSSRFPRPELEISFSPLQPNRMALRRQGEKSAVTVKITRTARKRKSGEMEKEEVEAENRRNTRSKLTPKLTPQKEESSSPAGSHESQSSRKEGTLQKIGDFLQSSPTLIGSKAKKMMSLMSGRTDADSAASSSSLALRAKKNRKKLYRPEISSPMEMPSHPILSREPESKESNHRIIKRRLRSKVAK